MTDQDPRALLGYRLYWKRIAMHINLRDIAPDLGATSVAISKFEKGDFEALNREQVMAYLDLLELGERAEEYFALMPEPLDA